MNVPLLAVMLLITTLFIDTLPLRSMVNLPFPMLTVPSALNITFPPANATCPVLPFRNTIGVFVVDPSVVVPSANVWLSSRELRNIQPAMLASSASNRFVATLSKLAPNWFQ